MAHHPEERRDQEAPGAERDRTSAGSSAGTPASARSTAGRDDDLAYQQLSAYTLSHGAPAFIHQHVVDAYGAQNARDDDRPIVVAFSLIGLHLYVDRGLTGREVQRVHRLLADRSRSWPAFQLPADRGSMTAVDVLAAPAGPARDEAIDAWCRAVWDAFSASKPAVEALLRQYGVV